MDTPYRVSDAVVINNLLEQYSVIRAEARKAQMQTFGNSSTLADQLIIEVYKGLISRSQA